MQSAGGVKPGDIGVAKNSWKTKIFARGRYVTREGVDRVWGVSNLCSRYKTQHKDQGVTRTREGEEVRRRLWEL